MEKTDNDLEHIKRCLILIEESLGWGDSAQWHNSVFIELSDLIQQRTSVLLSPTTLKRVWGKVKYKSAPSISTLNVLAQFIGYLNWRDFKNESVKNSKKSKKTFFKINQLRIFGYSAVIALLFISLFSIIDNNRLESKNFDFSKITFESRSVAKGLPNTVVFDLDLKGLKSDSIYIQQYWDRTKTIKLKPNQRQATGQYYFPGYFRAKLLVDGDIKKEHDLFIKSEKWLGTIDYEPIPKYFKSSLITAKNNLILPEDAFTEVKSSNQPLTSTFHFINDFGEVSADNFILKTSLRNIQNDKWAVCQKAFIYVIGTKSAMIIPFSISGCVSELQLMLSDVFLSGKENDLSAFGIDLSTFKEVEVSVENKNVKVSIDGEVIYMSRYNLSLGQIVGVRYKFLGAGEVDYLTLSKYDNDENIIDFGLGTIE